jgi:hypothetical protein
MEKLEEQLLSMKKLMGLNEDKNSFLLYHGSTHNFDKFSLNFIGSGNGKDVHGFGIYLTDNKEIAEYYSNELNRTQYIYTVKLVNVDLLLDWDSYLDSWVGEKIYRVYETMTENDAELSDMRDTLGLTEGYEDSSLVDSVYGYFVAIFGSKRLASEFLIKCGVDGIKFKSKENGFDSTNYVIFDANNIKILDKEIIE